MGEGAHLPKVPRDSCQSVMMTRLLLNVKIGIEQKETQRTREMGGISDGMSRVPRFEALSIEFELKLGVPRRPHEEHDNPSDIVHTRAELGATVVITRHNVKTVACGTCMAVSVFLVKCSQVYVCPRAVRGMIQRWNLKGKDWEQIPVFRQVAPS
jgi:hypothetical protein